MKKRKSVFLIPILVLSLFLLLNGCQLEPASDDPSGDDPVETFTAPPENLLGTIALGNGKSAVLDIQFSESGDNASIRATVSVSGNVRYEGTDYIAGGIYNSETRGMNLFAENTTTGLKFIIVGTYTPSEGFSGTVTLYSGSTVVTEGIVSAADAADTERDSIKIFTGTYAGGGDFGSWNASISGNSVYVSSSSSDTSDKSEQTLTMQVSGNTILYTGSSHGTDVDGPYSSTMHVTGTITGNTISGSWRSDWSGTYDGEIYTGTDYGSWTGAEVDNNHDPYVPTVSSDIAYLSNIILQAFENGKIIILTAIEAGLASLGSPYQNITLTVEDIDSDTIDESVFWFDNYIDSQTGLILSGYVLIEAQPLEGEVQHYYIDSDVSDFGNTPNNDGGLIVTFQDTTTIDLFIDTTIDSDNETITANQFVNPRWELGGTDVLANIGAIFF